MTELLNREKGLIQLNEELDKMTINANDKSIADLQKIRKTNDKRFYTYTTTKSIKHVDWAGDGAFTPRQKSPISDSDRSVAKSTLMQNSDLAKGQTNSSNNSKVSNFRNKFMKVNEKSANTLMERSPQKKKIYGIRAVTQSQSQGDKVMPLRPSYRDRRARNCKNENLQLCFHNANYTNSPSLELLVEEQSNSLQMELEIEAGLREKNETNKSVNETKNLLKADSVTKFLRSKIAILEEGRERLLQELTQQKASLEQTLEANKQINKQLEQSALKNNTFSEELAQAERFLETARRLDKERLLERSAILKELEAVKSKVQTLARSNSGLEKRLYQTQEELQNTKNALNKSKAAERQLQNANRAEDDKKNLQIKSLKKQRSDILNAYRKQLYLIDNLKHQNTCLENSKKVAISEMEFNKLLDWNKKT